MLLGTVQIVRNAPRMTSRFRDHSLIPISEAKNIGLTFHRTLKNLLMKSYLYDAKKHSYQITYFYSLVKATGISGLKYHIGYNYSVYMSNRDSENSD